MGSVDDNRRYYEQYDWSERGAEWSLPWGGTRAMWLTSLYPRISRFLPADRVLEIGSGHGRIARILHAFTTKELVLLDIVEDCVRACSKAFRSSSKTVCLRTDGRSLPGVKDNSVDLVVSFYSLVGVNADTIAAYMREFRRTLNDDGAVFLHHSNVGMYEGAIKDESDRRLALLAAYRDMSVDAERVQALAGDNDLVCITQECINWDIDEVLTDCFSTIVRPGSRWHQVPEFIRNPAFRRERELAALRANRLRRRMRKQRRP